MIPYHTSIPGIRLLSINIMFHTTAVHCSHTARPSSHHLSRALGWAGCPRAQKFYSYAHGYRAADFVLGLASPGAFPCPEASPSYNVQFSTQAGDGHYLAFGTEVGVCGTVILHIYVVLV